MFNVANLLLIPSLHSDTEEILYSHGVATEPDKVGGRADLTGGEDDGDLAAVRHGTRQHRGTESIYGNTAAL